ncbi:hypothetical protein ACFYNZ_25445 [Streptomyces kebangsaanensis]|uniref:Uncharacterized protein n=1 Tax=Streptomyces kebangsaanensis TaxID=864058 RepID=A0ABW6L285_9ACTN
MKSDQWKSGTTPWVRRAQPTAHLGVGAARFQCYFCGGQTATRSIDDVEADNGRIDLYCDNEDCAAREVTVIVRRDGDGAQGRADVRALAAIDEGRLDVGSVTDGDQPATSHGFQRPTEATAEAVVRRRNKRPY